MTRYQFLAGYIFTYDGIETRLLGHVLRYNNYQGSWLMDDTTGEQHEVFYPHVTEEGFRAIPKVGPAMIIKFLECKVKEGVIS